MSSHRYTGLIVLAIVFIALGVGLISAEASERVCVQCGEKIGGRAWTKVDGKYYHTEHFLCAHCLQPIENETFYEEDGRYYDSTCYVDQILTKCGYCGRGILGQYYERDGIEYHDTCFVGHLAYRCIVCDTPLLGQYFLDEFGSTVCALHQEGVDRCDACGRMLGAAGTESTTYRDGRRMCGVCTATAVTDRGQARALLEEIRALLGEEGIAIDAKVKIDLVSQQELARAAHEYVDDRLGVTVYKKEGVIPGIWSRKDYRIYILDGLPVVLFRSVLAHELMHVYLFKNGPMEQDAQMREGSCEYAASLILRLDTSEEANYYLRRLRGNHDPVYGEGFRKVEALVERIGREGWLAWVRENAQPPWIW